MQVLGIEFKRSDRVYFCFCTTHPLYKAQAILLENDHMEDNGDISTNSQHQGPSLLLQFQLH